MYTKFNLFLNELIVSRDELTSNAVNKKNLIEPALMTQDEYLSYLGAYKMHPDTAYQYTLENKDILSDEKLKDEYNFLNRKKHGSINIRYYVYNGKEKDKYIKHDKDNNALKDESGNFIYHTEEELKQKGIELFDKRVIALDDENNIVGAAQDEWNCVLVYVVDELKGLNIGQELAEYYRNFYPTKHSGGTTVAGFKNLKRYHTKQVKLYSRNGIYSDMVRNNEISAKRVKDIINSIDKEPIINKEKKENLYSKYFNLTKTHNKSILYGGTDIFLINDIIIKLYDEEDKLYNDGKNMNYATDFVERCVFAHTRIHEYDGLNRLYFIDGNTVDDIKDVLKYALSYIKHEFNEDGALYFITENTQDMTKNAIEALYKDNNFKVEKTKEKNKIYIKYIGDTKNYLQLLKSGTKWFYTFKDEYDQLKDKIAEEVYKKFQN